MNATSGKGGPIPSLLRDAWPRHTSKLAARAAGVAFETSRDWVRGHSRPLAETLLRMAANDDAMAEALRRRLDDLRADHKGGAASVARPAAVPVSR